MKNVILNLGILKVISLLLVTQKFGGISGLYIVDTCTLPLLQGETCEGSEEYTSRYYYDYKTGGCLIFSYSGCKGNSNNFATYAECVAACKTKKSHRTAMTAMRGLILDISDVDEKTVALDFESELTEWTQTNFNVVKHENGAGKETKVGTTFNEYEATLEHNFTADAFSQVEIDFLLFVANQSDSEPQFQIKLQTLDGTIEAVVFDLNQFKVSKDKWHELRFLSPLSDEKTDFKTVFLFKSSPNKSDEIFIDDIEVRLIQMMESQHLEHDPFLFKKPTTSTSDPATTPTSTTTPSTLASTSTAPESTTSTTTTTTATTTTTVSSTNVTESPTSSVPVITTSSEATTTVCNCSSTTPEVSTTTTTEVSTTNTTTPEVSISSTSPSPTATEYFPGNITSDSSATTSESNSTSPVTTGSTASTNSTTATSESTSSQVSSSTTAPNGTTAVTPTVDVNITTTVQPGQTENLIAPSEQSGGKRAELVVLGCLVVVLSLSTGFILFKYVKLRRSIGDYRVQSTGSRQTYNNPAYSVSSTTRSQDSFSS